uniref:hypothetical protein n=1 Tax=Flavobacterium sp. TaxID=239 RepID=UPI00404AB8C5
MDFIFFLIDVMFFLCLIGMIYFQISDNSASIFQAIQNPKYKKRVSISISDMKTEIKNSKNDDLTVQQLKKALNERRKFWVVFFVTVFLIFLKVLFG